MEKHLYQLKSLIGRGARQAICLSVALLMAFATTAIAQNDRPTKIDTSKLPQMEGLNVISKNLITAALPKPEHFEALADAGVDVVISVLSPTEESLPDLCAIQEAGLTFASAQYSTAVPVASMEMFRATMEMFKGKNILVFCRRNYRSSTMVYIWNRLQTGKTDNSFLKGKVSMAELIETVEPNNRHKLYDYIKPIEKHYGITLIK